MEYLLDNLFENFPYIAAFGGGLLSFLSPCVLPLAPAYIANLAGVTAIDPTTKKSVLPTLIHSVLFVLGFSTVFVFLGLIAGILGASLPVTKSALTWFSGIVIILLGIYLIVTTKIPLLNYEKRLHLPLKINPGYFRSLIIGAVFSLGWMPCTGPILGAIMSLAGETQQANYGALLLIMYSLGLGVPFILLGLVWGKIVPMWKNIGRVLSKITLVSGIILILTGVFIITNQIFSIFILFL